MIQRISRLAFVAFLLLVPAAALAQEDQAATNVNSRYQVESVSIVGVAEAKVSQALRDDMQKLVGSKYDPDAAEALAHRLRKELHGYSVTVKAKRGEHDEAVKVVFEAERIHERSFNITMAPFLYSTKDGFSGALVPGGQTHHNYFSVGLVSSADELLERNSGVTLRYEHRKVGTSMVQVGVEYDYFWPSFEDETKAALVLAPLVPGTYDTREVFSPSISFLPIPDIKLTFGASFQTLAMERPVLHNEAAHAFTFGAQYRRKAGSRHGVRHSIAADYLVRQATTELESDFLYTRQFVSGDYTLSTRHQDFMFRFQGGHIDGEPPLFDRFTIGNTATLRGWDKFDVAPLGGTRLLYGSLEYRYRPFQLFYDFGKVWDAGQQAVEWKHSLGIGVAWKNGFFMSLGVPLKYHDITPVFMIGFRL
jgi:outer membrane translocation and assembly module TamA